MTIQTTHQTRHRTATAERVLLRRRATVYVPGADTGADGDGPATAAPHAAGVDLLETDLLDRGWLLSAALRAALTRLDAADLIGIGSALLADCDALLGADHPHVPLFRDFPASVPQDTAAFYVDRVLTLWFQRPDQPCVLCETTGSVAPVNPCGHLVCRVCFDGSDFSACPICHRRIALDDPFLRPAKPRGKRDKNAPPPLRLRVLHLGRDLDADAATELAGLLARPTALSPADVEDLVLLLTLRPRTDLGWVPAEIPGRETKARLLAWLLAEATAADAADRIAALADTATDVLRMLAVLGGGDASLLTRPRIPSLPRSRRRLLLTVLDRIPPARLVEDMRRNRRSWIVVGERLHAGEHAARYPGAALAFAALRGTDLGARPSGAPLLEHAARVAGLEVTDGKVAAVRWGRGVEQAFERGDVLQAARVLATRPGELLRRTDHLLRRAGSEEEVAGVLAALSGAVPEVSVAVLLSTLGELRVRGTAQRSRVFFPASRGPLGHVVPDTRAPLAGDVVARAVALLEGEVLRRAGALPALGTVVIDAELDGLTVPFAERTASRALITVPRGSVLPIPAGRHLRLFCHWMDSPAQRVDLDLSVAFFDAGWVHVGTCAFTDLRSVGAVHSGDLTSAPAPLGASEFIDIDLDVLQKSTARYALMVVFSYNNVPFVELPEAFAGVMVRSGDPRKGPVFDPRAVEQRFDLTAPSRTTAPLVVDLAERTMRWLDVTASVTGTDHDVYKHRDKLSVLGSGLVDLFTSGARVSLGDLGRWHAAARATEVVVRAGDQLTAFRRRPGEQVPAFAARLRAGTDPDGPADPATVGAAGLQLLLHGDLPAAPGTEVYALHPGPLDPSVVRLLTASDLATQLA